MTETTGLLPALLAVQASAPTLPKDATNPHFKSRYTPLDTIVEVVGPILNRHGLVWTTLPGRDERGEPALNYRLAHAPTGEVLEGVMPLMLAKADAQSLGSAITYARRYALCAVLNLVADDDDDGNAGSRPGGPPLATAAQKKRLRTDITRHSLNADVMTALLRGVGLTLGDGEKVNDAINRLTSAQCSELIDEIGKGAVKTGGSDVPAPADDEFKHPPAGAEGEFPLDDPRASALSPLSPEAAS